MTNTNNNTIKWRVDQLEKNYNSLNEKTDLILQNHLPHIREDIQSLSTNVKIATAINIGAIVLTAVVLKYL